jgi:lipopolysaccharide biosynthesis protein
MELTKKQHGSEESFVFINAWNEWAEGCHLEPDRQYGRQFLEATLRAATSSSMLTDFTDTYNLFENKERYFSTDLKELFLYHVSSVYRNFRHWISNYPRLKFILSFLLKIITRLKSSIS